MLARGATAVPRTNAFSDCEPSGNGYARQHRNPNAGGFAAGHQHNRTFDAGRCVHGGGRVDRRSEPEREARFGDAAIKLETVVQLVPWARIPPATPDFDPRPFASGTANAAESNGPEIGVLTSNGLFAFTHIPPGDYTLRVWWEAGFPTGASASIPFVYQVVFSMSDDGAVGSPAVPPAEWKAVRGEPGNPEREVAVVGTVPTQILVNENPPGLVPFPVETDGASAALPVGSVDVAAAWTSSLGAVSVQLPSTGAGDDVDTRESLWLTGGGLALLAATGLALARRLRDGGRRAKR